MPAKTEKYENSKTIKIPLACKKQGDYNSTYY